MGRPGGLARPMDDSTLYAFALEATAFLALWLGVGVWRRDREAPGRLTFTALALAVFLWCLGLLLGERELAGSQAQVRIVFAGGLALPPLWLGVAAHAARLGLVRRAPWFPAALLLPGAFFYSLLYTGPWSALFLGSGSWPQSQGPLFLVATVYGYTLVLAATVVLTAAAFRAREPRVRRQHLGTALATVLPLAGSALFVFVAPRSHDPTPVLLGITLIALRSAVFRGGPTEALLLQHRDVYRRLPVGIVLTDRHDRVIDVNQRAAECLGVPRQEALGRLLEAVLASAPPGLETRTAPLRSGGHAKLRCTLLERPDAERDAA